MSAGSHQCLAAGGTAGHSRLCPLAPPCFSGRNSTSLCDKHLQKTSCGWRSSGRIGRMRYAEFSRPVALTLQGVSAIRRSFLRATHLMVFHRDCASLHTMLGSTGTEAWNMRPAAKVGSARREVSFRLLWPGVSRKADKLLWIAAQPRTTVRCDVAEVQYPEGICLLAPSCKRSP